MEILFLRHATTSWNADRRFQGSTDISLSEEGRTEAAGWLPFLPKSPQQIWCSPLARSKETAKILYPEREIKAHPGLAEMALGSWEGKNIDEVKLTLDAREWRGLDFADHGGESLRQVGERLRLWLKALESDELAVVISHKMAITAAYCLATGWQADSRPEVKLKFPRLHRFTWEGNELKVKNLNEPLGEL